MVDLSQVNSANAGPLYRFRHILRRQVGQLLRVERLVGEFAEIRNQIGTFNSHRTTTAPPNDGYDDLDYDVAYWNKVQSRFAKAHGELPYRNLIERLEFSLDLVANCLKINNVDNFINFGGSYPLLEVRLIERFRDMVVYSTNRYPAITDLNNEHFAGRDRLNFITTGEILEFLESPPDFLRGSAVHHSYVAMFHTESFVRQFYAALHRAGVEYIICVEPAGLSRDTLTYFRHSYDYQRSAFFIDHYAMHNYPNLMREAGYELVTAEGRSIVANKDWHNVGFAAKRV